MKRPRIVLNDAQEEFIHRRLKDEVKLNYTISREIVEELNLNYSPGGLYRFILKETSRKRVLGKMGVISTEQAIAYKKTLHYKKYLTNEVVKPNLLTKSEKVFPIDQIKKKVLKPKETIKQKRIIKKIVYYYEYI